MEAIRNYIETNRERFIEELFGLIRIPSVSASEARKPDMVRAAEYIRDMLVNNGADRAEVYPTKGNPVVYGEKLINASLPTILVYGHYDVMPLRFADSVSLALEYQAGQARHFRLLEAVS